MKKYNLAIVKILGYFGLPMYDFNLNFYTSSDWKHTKADFDKARVGLWIELE